MPTLAAASNWHALANFAGRYARVGQAIMIDIGSTTADLIPLVDGQPHSVGKTDPERLLSGELVYSGVERSPVCAVTPTLPLGGQLCPVAHELFATTIDAYVMLGD
jgi:probable H4MPT-linked C1 transfer pathway protein